MILESTVFISGFSIMVLEIIGIRMLNPFFGSSTYVLTSIISIVLLSLSIGYWLGGKKADKSPSFNFFFKIIFFSSILVLFIFGNRNYYLSFIEKTNLDYKFKVLLASLIMFLPINFLLGMISPYAVRLKLKKTNQAGSISGNLYAISTLGSIIGTFLTGFFLIPMISITKIVYLISIILFINSLLIFFLKIKKTGNFFILPFLLFLIFLLNEKKPKENYIAVTQSAYNDILVYDKDIRTDQNSIISVRYLITNKYNYQSAMFKNEPHALVFPVLKYFRLLEHFSPKLENVLVLGGGGYSYPKYFLKKFPTGKIDVVEIDPKITEIAKKYFFLEDKNPRLNIYHQDARVYINKNKKKYDAIIVDVFNYEVPPYYIATKEAVKKIFSSLSEKGVVIVNIVSAIEGANSRLIRSYYKTYSLIFPQIYVFDVHKNRDSSLKRNIILVCLKNKNKISFKSEDKEIQKYLNSLINKDINEGGLILLDDYAPVESFFR